MVLGTGKDCIVADAGRSLRRSTGVLTFVADVFGSIPIATLLVDQDGIIRLANKESARLLKYRRSRLVGLPVERLLPKASRSDHVAARESYQAAPTTRRMGADRNLQARRRDGVLVPVEIALRPVSTRKGPMVIAVLLDISAREERERVRTAASADLEHRIAGLALELERSNMEKIDLQAQLAQARATLAKLRGDPARNTGPSASRAPPN